MGWTEIAWVLLLGVFAGILSGMFGIGGGLIILPALMVIWKLDPKTAVGTSLFALLLLDQFPTVENAGSTWSVNSA